VIPGHGRPIYRRTPPRLQSGPVASVVPVGRLGVVLPVPPPLADEIRGVQRGLGRRGALAPHLTLVPPVNADAAGAADVVRSAAGRSAAVRLALGPAATFWPTTPVVYLAVAGDLDPLARLRDAVLAGPLDRPVTHPFVPHVTLAEHVAPERIPAAVAALADFRADTVLGRLQLLEERPGRDWDVLLDVPLGGPRVVGRGGLELALTTGEALDAEGAAFFEWAWDGHLAAGYGARAARPRPFAVTARREGAVVGVALGEVDEELWLDRLVVDPAVRGQGVGTQLLREVESVARSAAAGRAALVCRAGGPAEAFYRQRAWIVDLQLPGWRRGTDFVRMVRLLST
jgi:2'-5' RNA ligase